jgi:hypothetical protein
MSAQAFPLQWPEGWPRTASSQRVGGDRSKRGRTGQNWKGEWESAKPITLEVAHKKLFAELDRLRVRSVVLSNDAGLRADGSPRSGVRPADPGVPLYFIFRGRQMVMAQDAFTTVEANTRSLGLAIEAMRQLERHGGGAMMERAFTGFAALAPPKHWSDILGVPATATRDR